MFANAALVLVSLIVALGLGEGGLRLVGYAPYAPAATAPAEQRWSRPDPDLGWTSKPGRFLAGEPGNAPMNFDAAGHRTTPPGKPGAPRIDIVGDSITQGYAVADDETFAWRLAESRPDLAIVNLGVGGYGTAQTLLTMEKRRADPPSLFVYGFFGDHQYRNVAHLGWIRALRDADGHNIVPPHATIEDRALRFHKGETVRPWPGETNSVLVTEAHRAWMRLMFRARQDQRRPVLEALLARMKSTAADQRAKFIVLLLADAPDWLPSHLARQNIATADCREPEFERDPNLRVGGWGHPIAARHALWAECLAPAIDEALKN
jgi:hypothetical protein